MREGTCEQPEGAGYLEACSWVGMTEGEADGRSLGDNVEPTCLQASLGRSHSAIGLQRSLCRAYAVLGDGIGISDGRADGTNVGLHSSTLALSNRNAIGQSSLAPAGRRRGGTARLLRYRQHCWAAHSVHRWRRWRNGKRKSATSGSEAASGDTMVQGLEDLWARPMGSQRGCNPNRSVPRDASQTFEPR